jgi:hypothetical protein
MSTSPTFNAQLLGQTEKAANAILDRLLAEPGLTEPQWVALSLTAMGDNSLDRTALADRVAGALKVDGAAARGLVGALFQAGLAEGGAPVRLTDAGQQVIASVRAGAAKITHRLWGDLPPEDLAAAGRVLATVLERANAVLASTD